MDCLPESVIAQRLASLLSSDDPIRRAGQGGKCLPLPRGGGGGGFCLSIAGASVIASDGAYLGSLTNSHHGDSVLNSYGSHGSEYSGTSIWNTYGQYCGEYSGMSPFNSYTRTPPKLIKNGQVIGYLSVNEYLSGAVNPYALKSCNF